MVGPLALGRGRGLTSLIDYHVQEAAFVGWPEGSGGTRLFEVRKRAIFVQLRLLRLLGVAPTPILTY